MGARLVGFLWRELRPRAGPQQEAFLVFGSRRRRIAVVALRQPMKAETIYKVSIDEPYQEEENARENNQISEGIAGGTGSVNP